jgi:2-keto-4-pentenoate hydratase/2-oxohepta-3-ene-1,7-dioic acid hydratase in catechol pathway
MKIVRFSRRGRAQLGVLVADGLMVGLTADLGVSSELGRFLVHGGLERARELSRDYLSLSEGALVRLDEVHLLPPISPPCNLIGVGKNYLDHARETGGFLPERPLYFGMASTAAVGPHDLIAKPDWVRCLDYEVELGVVIGREARAVAEAEALDYVAGYTVVNDVTARELQNLDRQWFRAKSMDTFAPMGPWLVTADELPDPQNLELTLTVDGEVRQQSNTGQMIFSVAQLLADLTSVITLYPGDILATGTPSGVAMGEYPTLPKAIASGEFEQVKDDPAVVRALGRYLQPGSLVEARIEGIGSICNRVVRKKGKRGEEIEG